MFLMAKVSIIVPVYNTAKWLRECLDSVLAQTAGDWELIAVDDGSTDESPAILREYAAKEPRIRVVTEPNGGQGTARNRGLDLAGGEYVLFLDSDDVLVPSALEELSSLCDRESLDHLVFAAECFFDGLSFDGKRKAMLDLQYMPPAELAGRIMSGRELFREFANRDRFTVSPCLRILRRSAIVRCGLRFPERIILEDNAFTPFALLDSERAAAISKVFYQRRLTDSSTTAKPEWRVRRAADGLAAYSIFMARATARNENRETALAISRFAGGFLESLVATYLALSAVDREDALGRAEMALDAEALTFFDLAVRPAVVAASGRVDAIVRGRAGLFRRIARKILRKRR